MRIDPQVGNHKRWRGIIFQKLPTSAGYPDRGGDAVRHGEVLAAQQAWRCSDGFWKRGGKGFVIR